MRMKVSPLIAGQRGANSIASGGFDEEKRYQRDFDGFVRVADNRTLADRESEEDCQRRKADQTPPHRVLWFSSCGTGKDSVAIRPR